MPIKPVKTAIGIDLGTTNSCVAVYRNKRVDILPDSEGNFITPSYVTFYEDGFFVVGQPALEQKLDRVESTVYDTKRMIGKPFKSLVLYPFLRYWPFQILDDCENRPLIEITLDNNVQERHRPLDISARILEKMHQTAVDNLGTNITHAVITIPAYFNQSQREETIEAAKIAGFSTEPNSFKLITEPAAAAFAYGFDNKQYDGYNLLVFDLGGGTFDVTVVKVKNGTFKVLNLDGDSNLGGRDFDNRLFELCNKMIIAKHKVDCKQDTFMQQKLMIKVEEVKKNLSASKQDSIDLTDMFPDLEEECQQNFDEETENGDPRFLVITRSMFERECHDLLNRTMMITTRLVNEVKREAPEINKVLLVGGSTRMPMIKRGLGRLFPEKVMTESVNPDEAVAKGAAIAAELLLRNEKHEEVEQVAYISDQMHVPTVTIFEEEDEVGPFC